MLNKVASIFTLDKVRIRAKLVLPYFLLTFILALSGVFLVSTLINKSMEERFYAQLLAAAETAGESFKYREAEQLAALRAMIYTKGVSQAVADGDINALGAVLLPIKVNSHVYAVEVLDGGGRELLGLRGKANKVSTGAARFRRLPEVKKVLSGIVENGNDKFAFIREEPGGSQIFYTIGPIKQGNNIVGAILAGSSLPGLLNTLDGQSLAHVTFYRPSGSVWNTTIPDPGGRAALRRRLEKDPAFAGKVLRHAGHSLRESLKLGPKEYDLVYAPLTAGDRAIGLYSVALRDKYFMVSKISTKKSMVAFFAAGMVLVSLLGYALAKYISRPIIDLVRAAEKVSQGDLSQRVEVRGKDEIGMLASTFNSMSARIEERTNQLKDKIQELTILYHASSALKNSLDLKAIHESVTKIFIQSFKASAVVLLERAEDNDSLKATVAFSSDKTDIARLIGQAIKKVPEFSLQESTRLPADHYLRLEGVHGGGPSIELRSCLLIPLRAKGKSLGLILLSGAEEGIAGWANTSLLTAIGSEVAVALENARLYQHVARRLAELASLQKAGETMTSTLRLEQIIESIAAHAAKVAVAANVALTLVEPKTGRLETKYSAGPGAKAIGVDELERPESATKMVLKSGKPLIMADDLGDGLPPEIKAVYGPLVKDLIVVPLVAGGRTIGVLAASDKLGAGGFTLQDQRVLATLASGAALSIKNAYLYKDVKELFLSAVRSLVSAIDQKDPYTHGHSERVAAYSLIIADELGLPVKERENLEVAALLHDVGKIGISELILAKSGRLTPEEEALVREHPAKGVRIMEPMMDIKAVIPGMLYHHERFDGAGYPEGLRELAIPLQARIIAVADSFDAMTSNRPYRQKGSFNDALEQIRLASGIQFDPAIAKAFFRAITKRKARTRPGLQLASLREPKRI